MILQKANIDGMVNSGRVNCRCLKRVAFGVFLKLKLVGNTRLAQIKTSFSEENLPMLAKDVL